MTTVSKAIVLLSGGLDSSTCLAIAKKQGFELFALTISYGQRHSLEIEAARRVAASLGVLQQIVYPLDLTIFGGSSLTDSLAVPKDQLMQTQAIPNTYVPARNSIFLSLALAWADVIEAKDIFIGVSAVDYSGYPDCRPEFIAAFESLANVATRIGTEKGEHITIHAPLQYLTKAEIIRLGTSLGVDYSLTHSCYDPDSVGNACGWCDSCLLRKKGFREAGIIDPTRYKTTSANSAER